MYQYDLITPENKLETPEMKRITSFLFKHLDQYGDAEEDIEKCLQYAMNQITGPGGYVATCSEGDVLRGAVIVNKTGMSSFIPENILVYIAVHESCRGKGVGKQLMTMALDNANGDVALHCEPKNPARFLYEKLGFESKYLEMRYKKPS